MTKNTNFGFKKVKIEEKQSMVDNIFDSVASKYDLMNDFMSVGMHRIWKNKMVDELKFLKSKKYKIIDVAGGTGDISFRILEKAKSQNINLDIDIVDVNKEMLKLSKDRAIDKNYISNLNFKISNGENLEYNDNIFDYYTIAFGIRNFTNIQNGLKEAYRVLKPGGKFICLEFSQITNDKLSKLYDLYSFNIIPKIGKFIAKDEDSYQYLIESIRKFPDQEKFKKMITKEGFINTSYKNLNSGLVAIHIAIK